MNTHTRSIWIGIVIVILVIAGATWYFMTHTAPTVSNTETETPADEATVRDIVTDFGRQLQKVSLEGPDAQVASEIRANYAPYISNDLLQQWLANANLAPGRLTSSPYPDRIEIDTVLKNFDGSYTVNGKVVEVNNGSTATSDYPITLTLRLIQGAWKITDVRTSQLQLDANGQPMTEVYKG